MSAAVDLRAAAARLRALAMDANRVSTQYGDGWDATVSETGPDTLPAERSLMRAMSPPVALALADLLDVAATYADDGSEPVHEAALALIAALPTNGADHG